MCTHQYQNEFAYSSREKIALQVLDGKTYPEISTTMNLPLNTIKSHIKNIFNK